MLIERLECFETTVVLIAARGREKVVDMDTCVATDGEHPAAPAPNETAVGPLDLAHLTRYTLGDRDLERVILELFVGEMPRTIDKLRHASTSRDWCMAAHTLKGSCRAVGAWRLAQMAEQAERLGGVADAHACASAVRRIEDAGAEAEAFIGALILPA